MDRRKFLKVTAVTSTSATLASCGNPEHQLIRFVPDEEHVPGIAEWKPSLCPLCPAGCGLLVRVMDAAIGELISRLDALVSSGDQRALAFLKRPGRGQRDELVSLFLERFGAPPPVTFELFGDDVLRRANLLSFGHEQLPTFDLARSRYVLGFGADFLGTWNLPVAQGTGPFGRERE
jgi:hypothetical protein